MHRSITVFAVSIVLAGNAAAAGADPPLWTSLDFAEARQKAESEDRVLLVYATASWCPPCRQMERTTWQSDAVSEWFAEHGVALKLDVDHNRDLAAQLNIEAMPTLVAFREGKDFDRVVGFQSDQQLIAWLNNIRAGKRAIDEMLEAAGDRVGADGRVNVQSRLNLAQQLARGGAIEEAVDEYLWLWDNMLDHQPAMYGVRLSFMISDMQRLARQHHEARDAFRELRESYWPRVQDAATASRDDVVDWLTLAKVVGEDDSLLEWFDAVRERPDGVKLLRHGSMELSKKLIEADRWADVAVLYKDPVEDVRRVIEAERMLVDRRIEGFDEAAIRRMQAMTLRLNRERFAQKYAVLLAADRDNEAEQIAQLMLDWDDSTASRGMLVTTALKAGQPRLHHLKWVDEAEEMGARVPRTRRQLTDLLGPTRG